MNDHPNLSVVVIARNEVENIARAIESVLREVKDWPNTEIVLVDSASTDGTVDVARQYPISIVRLSPTWFLSPSAGRHIGTCHTQGDLILFLDGDMELVPGALPYLVSFILEHPEVAGVTGNRRDIHAQSGQIDAEDHSHSRQKKPVETEYLGGASLYRRSALQQVGGFNPFMFSNEEPELGLRLRQAGYKLMILPYLMHINRTLPLNSWQYYMRRFRANLLLGQGQILRYHWGTPIFWTALRESESGVLFFAAGAVTTVVALLLAVVFQSTWILAAYGGGILIALGYFRVKKRTFRDTLMSIVGRAFNAYGVIRGLFLAPRSPADYPTRAEIVQVGFHRGGLS